MADHEDRRAESLLVAQAKAEELFAAVADRGLVAPGAGEREVSDRVRDLANEMFGPTRHWHKRIVRSGPNTLLPYRENPPDRVIDADDIAFADFGPIFEEFEADFGRTFVLGADPVKQRLRDDLPVIFRAGQEAFAADPDITGQQLHETVAALASQAGWTSGGWHAGSPGRGVPARDHRRRPDRVLHRAGQHHAAAPRRPGRAALPLDPGDPPDRPRARLRRLLRAAPRPRLSPESRALTRAATVLQVR